MIKRHYTDIDPEEVTMYGSTNTTIQWLITKEDGAPRFALRRFVVEPEGIIDHFSKEYKKNKITKITVSIFG